MSKSKSRRYSTSEESVDSAEEERKRDLKERDEFADRLKKKDEGKTRKVVEVKSKLNNTCIAFIFLFIQLRLPTEKATKKLPSDLNWKTKIVTKYCLNYEFSRDENTWKSVKMTRWPNWKLT